MANPWDQDEIVGGQPAASANPWDADEIVAPAQSHALEIDIVGGTPASREAVQADLDATQGMSGYDKFAAGMGKSFADSYRGLKQAGTEALGYVAGGGTGNPVMAVANQLAGAPRRFDNAVTQFADQSLAEQQAEIDRSNALDADLMGTGAGLAGNVTGYAAQVLAPGAALRGTTAARALLPTTVAGNAVQGAALGALQPVSADASRAENAAIGGAFGAGGAGLAKAAGSVATGMKGAVSDQARAVYQAAKERGIDLSPAQISDSRFLKWAQSMLRSVPFTGAQGRFEAQVGDFNRALAKTIGEDAPLITREVNAAAKARQSAKFDELTARNALKVDDRLVRSLTNIAESSKMAGDQIQNQVDSAIDSLYSQATTGPGGVVIPGEAYQAFDSQLNQIIKNGGAPSHFLGNVQKAVRRAMDDSISPEDAAAWRTLRREYGNRKALTPLVAKANDGNLSPAQVQGAVTATKSGKERAATGAAGELGELARIGQRMKEPPSSGSAERGMVSALLGTGAYLDPVSGGLTAIGLNALSRGLDSKILAQVLMRQNPGMTLQVAEQVIRRSANPAGQTYVGARAQPQPVSP